MKELSMSDYISYYTEKYPNATEEEKHDLYEELVEYTTGKCKELFGKTDEDIEENHGLVFFEDLQKLEDRKLAANYLALNNLILMHINEEFDKI